MNIYSEVAKLHIDNLNEGFLPSLGVNFLTLMYERIDHSAFATLIIIEENGEIVGFVTGSLGNGSIFLEMIKCPIRLFTALGHVLLKPRKFLQIFEVVLYVLGSKRSHHAPAELLTIAVASYYRGRGVASRLFDQLVKYFDEHEVEEFTIIVGKDLEANHFYNRKNCEVVGELAVHKGRLSNVYTYRLSEDGLQS